MDNEESRFQQWMKEVNKHLPISTDDLADCPYRDMYDNGDTPLEAAREALELNGMSILDE